MNILIIGGSGFLGYHLTESLLKKSYKVTVVDSDSFTLTNLDGSAVRYGAITVFGTPSNVQSNIIGGTGIWYGTSSVYDTIITLP